MNTDIIALIVATAAAAGTFIANLFFKFFSKSIDSLFEHWRFAAADKRKLANEILDLCAEAQEGDYKKLPENERKIHQLLNYLESIESHVFKLLVRFYNNWITATTVADKIDSKEEKEFLDELLNDTEKSRKQLVKAVGKWKK